MFELIIIVLVSYLIGSISPSYIFGRIHHMDIRKTGSGNAGTTNTLRVLGKKIALAVFVIDFFKGFFVAFFVRNFFSMNYALIAAVSVVLGHIFPVFLGFKGGKGVATTLGVLYCLFLKEILICSVIGIILLVLFRYVSFAGLVTLFLVNIVILIFNQPHKYLLYTGFLFILIAIKHKENIKRLINHTERKIGEKS
ncbi:acyl-phosphate glycerol 3-phosphate acyltransferase [Peptostreptococcaceae bacterium AS15]|nr:acyl-phosphate glycerol 3-phosphate acyltransferase [Peptostreptococcaceae bacterium AS15]